MGTALILLGLLVAIVVIPLVVGRISKRHSADVDGYLYEQHGSTSGRQGSWPAGGGHIGL